MVIKKTAEEQRFGLKPGASQSSIEAAKRRQANTIGSIATVPKVAPVKPTVVSNPVATPVKPTVTPTPATPTVRPSTQYTTYMRNGVKETVAKGSQLDQYLGSQGFQKLPTSSRDVQELERLNRATKRESTPEDYVQAEYNKGVETGEKFDNIFGDNPMFSSAEEAMKNLANEQKAQREYQAEINTLSSGIDQRQLEATKRESEAAQATATTTFAQNREGAMSGTAQDVIARYGGISNERMQTAQEQVALAELQRREAERQLRSAQANDQRAAIARYQGAVAQAEQAIKQANTDLANAEAQALSDARQFMQTEAVVTKTKQETTLANLEAMGSAIANLNVDELQRMGESAGFSMPQMLTYQKAYQLKAEAEQTKNEVEAAYKMAQSQQLLQQIQFDTEDRDMNVRLLEAKTIIEEKKARGEAVTVDEIIKLDEYNRALQESTGYSQAPDITDIDVSQPGANAILGYTRIFAGSPANADGVDFVAPVGTPIKSNINGEVIDVVSTKKPGEKGWGNRVVVVDSLGNKHTYNHLSKVSVKIGDPVTMGTPLGAVGNTGTVMGGNGESLSAKQLAEGRGSHLDYTVFKPDGSRYTVGEAFKMASVSTVPKDPVSMQRDIMISLSAIPTQLRNSDAEQKRYETLAKSLLQQGKTPQEVSDTLLGFQVSNPNDVPVARKLRTVALGTDLNIADLARAVNEGDFVKAVNLTENAALKNVDKDFANTSNAEKMVSLIAKANRLSSELKGKGQGVFDEKLQKWKIKFPIWVIGEDEKKAADLAATLTDLNAAVRNELAGTAVTSSEGQFLESYLSSIKDQPEILGVKLNQMQNGILTQINAARRAASLPEVSVDSLLDRNKRIKLYRESLMPQAPQIDDTELYSSINKTFDDSVSSLWDNLK